MQRGLEDLFAAALGLFRPVHKPTVRFVNLPFVFPLSSPYTRVVA
jgi:hypothetical protein